LINAARASTLQISDGSDVTIRDLTIDFDSLSFTQGTIASFDRAAREIVVKSTRGGLHGAALNRFKDFWE
jgi:hypothetical protein